MFEYTRAGLALNGLIGAVQKGNSREVAEKLAKVVRFDAQHIVDNFLGNLKIYSKLNFSEMESRKAAAIHAMELVERVVPGIADVLDVRMAQGEAIERVISEDGSFPEPLSKEEAQARKEQLRQQAKIAAEHRRIDEWRKKNA